VRKLGLGASGVWRRRRRRWVRAAGWDPLKLESLRLADLQPATRGVGCRCWLPPASSNQALGGGDSLLGCWGAWAHGSAASSSSSKGKRASSCRISEMRALTRTPTKHDPTTLTKQSNSFLNSPSNAHILWEVTTVFLDRNLLLQRCWVPVWMVDGLRLASHLFCNSRGGVWRWPAWLLTSLSPTTRRALSGDGDGYGLDRTSRRFTCAYARSCRPWQALLLAAAVSATLPTQPPSLRRSNWTLPLLRQPPTSAAARGRSSTIHRQALYLCTLLKRTTN
jgi:hypothetical protein